MEIQNNNHMEPGADESISAVSEGMTPEAKRATGLSAMREKLQGKRGQTYWRTLEEVSESDEFKNWFEDEFPNRDTLLQINRRDLLRFMGASLALAGLTGCRGVFLPEDKVVPYVKAPEELVPGKALFYASSVLLAGYATGVLVEQHEGRPIKYEGNPDHSASMGALDAISQAEVLNLYDPDRAQNVVSVGDVSTWEMFYQAARPALMAQKALQGAGLRILTGAITSPTLGSALADLKKKYPEAKFHAFEPAGRANVHMGAELVGLKNSVPIYDFSKAKVILSLDHDFVTPVSGPGSLKYARDFANGRRVEGRTGTMNRLYVVDSTATVIGASADHRYPVTPSAIYGVALEVASRLGVAGLPPGKVEGALAKDIDAIVKDLIANKGASVVTVGEHHAPEVHAVVHLINASLGSIGTTVNVIPSPEENGAFGSIDELAGDLAAGKVDFLYIMGGNPAYDAPADLGFADLIGKAKISVYHGLYANETAEKTTWSLPMTHVLEEWGDAKGFDGTLSIVQPLIAPLYDGRSAIEVATSFMADASSATSMPLAAYDIVRGYWKERKLGGQDFEKAWRTAVHDGIIPRASASAQNATPRLAGMLPVPRPASGLEVAFLPDPSIYDGRYSNNGWLQELPKPLTKLTWDNVVLMAGKDAEPLGLVTDDKVKLTLNGVTIEGTAFILPGHPRGTVTVYLGYGRTAGGTIATVSGDQGGGFNAYVLRTSKNMAFASGATLVKVGGQNHIASTQGHSPLGGNTMPDDRDVIRAGTLSAFIDKGMEALKVGESLPQNEIKENNLYPDEVFEWNGPQWGMTIDMNVCNGCHACVTACQAENNISVVGKEQVGRNREMHWIRIDRYYTGDDENPDVVWQPIMCVHCEKAPCEPVCPVAATVHSHDGLNQMVYNRCVGTRYCSNNCPYKVRRFNYLNYSDNQQQFSNRVQPWSTRAIPGPINSPKDQGIQLLKMLNNPEVTVRGRGVMEKCTYCVQRINEARIESKKAGDVMKDGDVVTACQQACPAGAIVFGNIADKESRVSKLRNDPRSYLLLEELQTRPRTSHLAKLRNPNPEIKA